MSRRNRTNRSGGTEPADPGADPESTEEGDLDEETDEETEATSEPADPGAEYWENFAQRRFELDVETRVRHLYIVARGGRSSEFAEILAEEFAAIGPFCTANELAVFVRVAQLAGAELELTPDQLEASAPLGDHYTKAIT